MRRVLLVSYHFPPSVGGGVPRLAAFARLLPEFGWAVTVLTAPQQGRAALDPGPLSELSPEVRVVRAYCPFARLGVRGHQRSRGGVAGRGARLARSAARLAFFPDREVFWSEFAVRRAERLVREEHHDVVLASYGPGSNALAGARIARRHGLPLVLDYRDLWSDLPFAEHATGAHVAALRALEDRIARTASHITTVSPGMTDHMRRRFARDEREVTTIVNGFDDRDVARVRDARSSGERPFELLYTGAVYGPYDFGPFFRALARLKLDGTIDRDRLRMRFVGNMSVDEPARHGVEDICVVEPFVPRAEVFEMMARADGLVAIEGGGYWARFGYPVKLFDYVLTGKPILGLVEPGGNSARLLDELDQRHVARPDDEVGIANAITRILRTKGAAPRAVAPQGPPLSAFRRRTSIEKLALVLESTARAGGPRTGAWR